MITLIIQYVCEYMLLLFVQEADLIKKEAMENYIYSNNNQLIESTEKKICLLLGNRLLNDLTDYEKW